MRRRLGLAAALIGDPTILLLDEPTAGLDPLQRVEMREMLSNIAGEGRVVVLSTHLAEDVAAVAERVVVMSRGTVRFQGNLEMFAGDAGDAGAEGVEDAFRAAVRDG